MSILDKFDLDMTAFGAITDPTMYEGSGTTTLRLDKRVPYGATISGVAVPAYVTLRSAKLTRISLLKQQQVSTGRDYLLATGIFKPVQMDIDLLIDGKEISLVDFLHHVVNQASGTEITRDEFVLNARRIGFNFAEGMPLFFQQFGTSAEGFNDLVEAFKAEGAKNALGRIENAGRIKEAYEHSGVTVTSFEIGTVDRSKSPRNQGFLNLVDAQIEQFTRILGLRKQARNLKDELENNSSLTQEQIKSANLKIKTLTDMSRQWVSSWSGAQKRIVNDNGNFVEQDQYDPVSAPCGRFTLLVGGNEVPVDLWSNSTRANNVDVPAKVIGNKEPF